MLSIEELLTVRDVSSILKIGRDKSYELVKKNLFPSIKIGKTYRIPKDSFIHWIEYTSKNNINISI